MAAATLSGQPLSAGPALSLWGLPFVVSAALASGTAIVGAFRRAAALYRKGTIRLDLSNSHADFFIKNLIAVRAELRELLAVYKPKGFAKVTGLTT